MKKTFVAGCISRAILGYGMIAILVAYLLCFKFDFVNYRIGSIALVFFWVVTVGMFADLTRGLYRAIKKGLKEIEKSQG